MSNREAMVNQMIAWKGITQGSKEHKQIVDTYNKQKPLPAGYKVKYTDNWCATTTSAAAIVSGNADVVPMECSCGRLIEKAKKMGIWVEDDSYTPQPGDLILYDWDDKGAGDDNGWPDHIGCVTKVTAKTIFVMEGNSSKQVKERRIAVNAQFIRGYVVPKYEGNTVEPTNTQAASANVPNEAPTKPQTTNSEYIVGETYALKSNMKVRTGAGTENRAKAKNELTADGQKHANESGCLVAGTRVTCKEVKALGNDVWIRTPSGWIAAVYGGKVYAEHVSASSSAGAPATPQTVSGTVIAKSGLNVRSGAGTNHGKLYAIPCNTKVEIFETVKDSSGADWYHIHVAGKADGFVKSEYVRKG